MSVTIADFVKRFGTLNWTSLLAGWRGLGLYKRLVTLPEIDAFATEKLMSAPGSDPDVVKLIISISDSDTEETEACLAKLAAGENATYEHEMRKWVVCLLEERLRKLPEDSTKALLDLTYFSSELGYPEYSPHQIQGRGNNISPENYYTTKNDWKTLERHRQWIEQETMTLLAN